MENYDMLKLENQLCFPLYAASREVVKKYTPLLAELGLTYTQYITLMVLWQHKSVGVKKLGESLHLDSGTLTPLLKKMEQQGLVARSRLPQDERNVVVSITPKGEALKEKAAEIPAKLGECLNISAEDAQNLYTILYKILDK